MGVPLLFSTVRAHMLIGRLYSRSPESYPDDNLSVAVYISSEGPHHPVPDVPELWHLHGHIALAD